MFLRFLLRPHDEANTPRESHVYVFPFLLGVRGYVFEVPDTPMRWFRPDVVVVLVAITVAQALCVYDDFEKHAAMKTSTSCWRNALFSKCGPLVQAKRSF